VLLQRLPSAADLDEIAQRHLPDVRKQDERLSVALRLWAGYMDAAKVIAASTRYETNDAATRQRDIPHVEAHAAVYCPSRNRNLPS
jgi:hypothetical protein